MIIDCIGCCHGFYPKLEGGDLLIVAGDLTARNEPKQYLEFNDFLKNQDYKHIIVIAGNHDNCLQSGITFLSNALSGTSFIPIYGPNVTYLCDSGTEFEGLKIWGSPWTRKFKGQNPKAMAFCLDTEEELAEKWAMIPSDTDILITHGPSYGILDGIPNKYDGTMFHVGSKSLSDRISGLRLKYHIFGHLHESYGSCASGCIYIKGLENEKVLIPPFFINCSHVNENYEPVNKPIRLIL